MTERTTGGRRAAGRESARGAASDVSGEAGEAAADIGQEARQAAGQVAAAAREKADELKGRADEAAREKKSQAAEMLGALSTALHAASDSLRQQRQDSLGRMGAQTADQMDRMASYLRHNDMRGLMDDVERFARRNPAALLGISFVGGLLAGRFLRSSSPDREHPGAQANEGSPYPTEYDREQRRETWREPDAPSTLGAGGPFAADPGNPMIGETSPLRSGMPQHPGPTPPPTSDDTPGGSNA
jgi:hypothetical protein